MSVDAVQGATQAVSDAARVSVAQEASVIAQREKIKEAASKSADATQVKFDPVERSSMKVQEVDLQEASKVQAQSHTEMIGKVRGVIPKLNSVMHSLNLQLRFEEFQDSGRFYVKAIDMVEEKEVSRTSVEDFLKQAEVTKHFVNGLFLDQAR